MQHLYEPPLDDGRTIRGHFSSEIHPNRKSEGDKNGTMKSEFAAGVTQSFISNKAITTNF